MTFLSRVHPTMILEGICERIPQENKGKTRLERVLLEKFDFYFIT